MMRTLILMLLGLFATCPAFHPRPRAVTISTSGHESGLQQRQHLPPFRLGATQQEQKQGQQQQENQTKRWPTPPPANPGLNSAALAPNSIIEYVSPKGSKCLAIITRRSGTFHVEAVNDARLTFTIPIAKISFHIPGKFEFGDLLRLQETIDELRPNQVERLWEDLVEGASSSRDGGRAGDNREGGGRSIGEQISRLQDPPRRRISAKAVSSKVFGTVDAIRLYATHRLMTTVGSVFFEPEEGKVGSVLDGSIAAGGSGSGSATTTATADNSGGGGGGGGAEFYTAFPPATVQANLRDRSALREFKQRYKRVMEARAASRRSMNLPLHKGANGTTTSVSGGNDSAAILSGSFGSAATSMSAAVTAASAGGPLSPGALSSSATSLTPDLPERVQSVLESFGEGLKQIVIKTHPWVLNGSARRPYDDKVAAKGRELLDFLDLAPSVKNAKRLLTFIGIWPQHTNIEKYIMNVRDKFPQEVLDEADFLVNNPDQVPDMDERIRRDLRHLGTYAIDREGAAEVDDAISIEYLEQGGEKLWIHIADVGRWVRPGSRLSMEAERRMLSVYLPDEKISMFPEVLSTELLSLGAGLDSYALSCGVTLNEEGEVLTYEVCPSLVRVTRRLSYSQLDDILVKEKAAKEMPVLSNADVDLPALLSGSTSSGGGTASSTVGGGGGGGSRKGSPTIVYDPAMAKDITRLNHWARVRLDYRNKQGALDQYLRHKTELYLNVKKEPKNPSKYTVTGHTSWSNATSMSLVSEYMILMCQTVGSMCQTIEAPVWYKLQNTFPPLAAEDLELKEGESLLLRSARIMRHMHTAVDSKTPGPHCTSGSKAYVQCTSPIRRYHDLYNHYRLKAAMHAASMSEEMSDRAAEEAGITKLDSMATAESRLATLNTIRLVTRQREQYWMSVYIERQLALSPRVVFDCLVTGTLGSFEDLAAEFPVDEESAAAEDKEGGAAGPSTGSDVPARFTGGFISEVLILQLGSFTRYKLYSRMTMTEGALLRCHLNKRYPNPGSYILTLEEEEGGQKPLGLTQQLTPRKKSQPSDDDDW